MQSRDRAHRKQDPSVANTIHGLMICYISSRTTDAQTRQSARQTPRIFRNVGRRNFSLGNDDPDFDCFDAWKQERRKVQLLSEEGNYQLLPMIRLVPSSPYVSASCLPYISGLIGRVCTALRKPSQPVRNHLQVTRRDRRLLP
ncbi:hypothetical protein MRB53_040995 [Persea americana]|nr:hypothetical protein MRB53_040995 [Persea americana]